jgi:hypothetical protein
MYLQTDPTQKASIRGDEHIQLRRIQTDPTQRASIREDQHIQLRRIQTDPTQREDQHIVDLLLIWKSF